MTNTLPPLDSLDPSRTDRFADGSVHDIFTRLRAEAPVHYCSASEFGPYWSICAYRDIIEIEALPQLYSSDGANGGISIFEPPTGAAQSRVPMFIAMDPPVHTEKRRVVAPAFTPSEITRLSASIRERTQKRLNSLPRGEVFDWVPVVSTDLTTDMLAILFDFPWEERHKLPFWSDTITSLDMIRNGNEERIAHIWQMAARFHELWEERTNAAPAPDLLSRMIHSNALGKMEQQEFMGNMMLLIVGGNDTTRNSMSGLVDAMTRWPDAWAQICADRTLAANAANEIIRWQSPVNHMRRTVMEDVEFRGHRFRKGDKIVLWYVSGNRDESVFEAGERFIPTRENARRHISFGYGVHRCVGARLAELQVSTLIDEMAACGMRVELAGDIVRDPHPFVSIVRHVPVRVVAG